MQRRSNIKGRFHHAHSHSLLFPFCHRGAASSVAGFKANMIGSKYDSRLQRARRVEEAYVKTRKTAAQRGYDYRWQKASKEFLKKNPWCAECAKHGKKERAIVVDHTEPHHGDKKKFWDRRNWQGLCDNCHNSWKQSFERSGVGVGCDVDGLPTHESHPWFQK